jgi:hypothetical protein
MPVRKKCNPAGGINTKGSPFPGLFENLSYVIDVSRSKFDSCHAMNSEKLRFGKLIVEAARAYSSIYEVSKLDNFEQRIKVLEEAQKQKA